jgi:ABC-type bacteriocin/lantibiotic exporter with double-glycine peptidase domain
VQRLFLCSAFALTIGCAGLPAGDPIVSRADPPIHQLTVPFFADETDQCGPSTLASVLNYWGIPATPEELRAEMYIERVRGSLPFDLVLAAERRTISAQAARGTLDALKAEVRAGRPVIVLLNIRTAERPYGHFIVVTGYDDDRLGLVAHSGPKPDSFIPYATFLPQWDRGGRWMLVAGPAWTVRKP